jgi:hypothetical protein
MKYLDAILRYISQNEYTHRENVAIIIADLFEQDPNISLEKFIKEIKAIKKDFFRINKLDRTYFAGTLYVLLNKAKEERPDKQTGFVVAKDFISKHFEIGFDSRKFKEERSDILNSFESIKIPHQALIKAFNNLLEKFGPLYKVDLHGVKEYSGIDIGVKCKEATIGFQIKSRSDDITEPAIRSETSKAQDWNMNGFVLVYGRKRNKSLETSVQASYHHFKVLIDSGRMYCAVLQPELFAELLRMHSISLS